MRRWYGGDVDGDADDGGAGSGTGDEEAGHSGRKAEVAKEVGGVGDGVEEVGSDGEGDAVGVVVATMATMTTEMLATRAMGMVTNMATMTSVMGAEIMAMVMISCCSWFISISFLFFL